MTATAAMVSALNKATPAKEVKHRALRAGGPATLAYIDARYVMDALDEGVGPESWQSRFEDVPGGVRCGIGINIEGEWVWKWDASPWTDREPLKGGHSKALVRAAVHWGIARDLYEGDPSLDDPQPRTPSRAPAGPPSSQVRPARSTTDVPDEPLDEWDAPQPIRKPVAASNGSGWTFGQLAQAAEDKGIAKVEIYRTADQLFGPKTKVTDLEPGQREQIAFEMGLV